MISKVKGKNGDFPSLYLATWRPDPILDDPILDLATWRPDPILHT
jgi:hypothetical protein